jgi:hypothetical protein
MIVGAQFFSLWRNGQCHTLSGGSRNDYLDAGPIEKPGLVTAFDRPRHISFLHTVRIRQRLSNTDVEARIRYTLDPNYSGTFVNRTRVSDIQSFRDLSSGTASSPSRLSEGKQPDASCTETIC